MSQARTLSYEQLAAIACQEKAAEEYARAAFLRDAGQRRMAQGVQRLAESALQHAWYWMDRK